MNNSENFALPKRNLVLLAIGFAIIVIGFVCMIGGGSPDGVSFNPEIFSPMRITVAPIIVMIGFSFEIVAILWIRKEKTTAEEGLVRRQNSRDIATSDFEDVKDFKDSRKSLNGGYN